MIAKMTPDAIMEKSNGNGNIFEDLETSNVKAKKTSKPRTRRGFSARENVLCKALTKQRQVSQEWCDELELTHANLKKANETLQNYKLANKGKFEMAVDAETSRRLKDICQPLGKAIQLNLNNVVCMLKSLTDMKTLVASLSKHAHSITPPCIEGYKAAPKVAVVQKRRNVVHPMVKGHVLHPATINIPRVSMSGQQSCILNNSATKRKKQPEVSIVRCTEIQCIPIGSEISESAVTTESGESSDAVEQFQRNSRARKRRKLTTTQLEISESGHSSAITEGNENKIDVPEVINTPSSLREEDPLEGPSWLYNGRRRKNEQNRKKILERIKKGNKAPVEYLVYIDSSSDSETEGKRVSDKKPAKKRRKYTTEVSSSRLNSANNDQSKQVKRSKSREHSSSRERMVADSMEARHKLAVPRGCSVVLIRPQGDFGMTNFRTGGVETPSDKENIPPVRDPTVVVNGNEIKLRGFAVVIEDIMKKHGFDTKKHKTITKKTRKMSIGRKHPRSKVRTDIKSKIRKINSHSKITKNKPKLFPKTTKAKLNNMGKSCSEIPFVSVVKQECDMDIIPNVEQLSENDPLEYDIDPLSI